MATFDDDSAGLPEYTDVVVETIANRTDPVVVAHSLGAFPARFLRRVARERLGITPDEIEGGHTPALSRPKVLADRLEAYAALEGASSG